MTVGMFVTWEPPHMEISYIYYIHDLMFLDKKSSMHDPVSYVASHNYGPLVFFGVVKGERSPWMP